MINARKSSLEAATTVALDRFTPTTPDDNTCSRLCDKAIALPSPQGCGASPAECILDAARGISACEALWPSSRLAVAESLLDDLARILARMTLDMHRGDLPSPGA